ncbi:MAG: SRPBCC family protein [Chloroflexi bacterium]|nr:SRPBCC family protein [Chloroflexota bacterium]
MARIQREIDIACPPDEVFAVLTDLDKLPAWASIVAETSDVSDRPLRVGCTFRQRLRVLGQELESSWRVTDLDVPRLIAYEATGPAGSRLDMKQTVRPVDGGARVLLEIDYDLPGGLIGEALDRVVVQSQNESEAEQSLERLRGLLERR